MALRLLTLLAAVLLATACGGPTLPTRAPTTQQALTQTAEFLEFETATTRADLYKEVARASIVQAGSRGPVLFPVLKNGELGAPRPAAQWTEEKLLVEAAS